MATTIRYQLRRDTSANWENKNPILAAGEPGFDVTANRLKIGDGNTDWNNRDYLGDNLWGIGYSMTYDGNGNPKSATFADGIVATFTCDSNGNVTRVVYSKNGVTLKTATITYNSDGNITNYEVS